MSAVRGRPGFEVADARVRRPGRQGPFLVAGQPVAEPGGAAHLVIARDPAARRRAAAPEPLQGRLAPRSVLDLLGPAGLLAALAVLGPLAGQVEPGVDRGVGGVTDVAEVDADRAEPAAPRPRPDAAPGWGKAEGSNTRTASGRPSAAATRRFNSASRGTWSQATSPMNRRMTRRSRSWP